MKVNNIAEFFIYIAQLCHFPKTTGTDTLEEGENMFERLMEM